MGASNRLRSFLTTLDTMHRGRAAELTRFELRELENVFVLLTLGSLVGIPSPPAPVAVELLPLLEHELKVLGVRARQADDALAELSGLFEPL